MSKIFGIGGSASKSSSKSTSTTSGSTTPILPSWITDLSQQVGGRVGDLLNLDPNSVVAPTNALQQRAALVAGGLNASPWNYDAAADLTRGASNTNWINKYTSAATPTADAGEAASHLNPYMNPYLQSVVDSTAADLDTNAGQVRAQQALDLAGSGAFGGSGAALTQSMTEGELARARASTLSGLRSQAFNTALGAATGDADRATQVSLANAQNLLQSRAQNAGLELQGQQQQLAAGNQLANLSSEYDANQRANIATQQSVGDSQRNVTQEQLQAPITTTQQIVAALNGLPLDLFKGEQTNSTTNSSSSGTNFEIHADAGASTK